MLKDLLLQYLRDSNLENFLVLRESLLSFKGYDPYSTELDGIRSTLDKGDFEEAAQMLQDALFPNYFLSPGAHLQLGYVFEELGKPDESEFERMIGFQCFRGIELTGNGSLPKPYLVTRISDEYDVLMLKGLEFKNQKLMEQNDKKIDVVNTKDGQVLYFDVTQVIEMLDRS